jgi:N-glycosylase/DNA lyase
MLSSIELDVDASINSGQVFLWEKYDNTWYGINGKDVLSINENPFRIRSSGKTPDFFRKTDNLEKILNEINKDKIVKSAVDHSNGLRLLRQDPFQCYISFIVSSNSNIQNIKQTLQKLCKKFGKKIEFEKKEFFLFPKPEVLSKASKIELQSCGLGYRARFVKEASSAVSTGKINFDKLKKMNYQDSKSALIEVFGIGNKVADCILLFSLEKLDAFPLDRWMLRILQKYYSEKFTIESQSLTDKKYNELHEKIVSYFGPYAGYSQQFLFKMERDLTIIAGFLIP